MRIAEKYRLGLVLYSMHMRPNLSVLETGNNVALG